MVVVPIVGEIVLCVEDFIIIPIVESVMVPMSEEMLLVVGLVI